jgi:type IV secretory pathway VirB2 component (pilin)
LKNITGEPRSFFKKAHQRGSRCGVYRLLPLIAVFTAISVPAFAQAGGGGASDPWTTGVTALQTLFTGTVAKGLSLVAIVVGGLMFAFGEGGSMKMMSGIVFGVGMAVLAASFLTWLFGV